MTNETTIEQLPPLLYLPNLRSKSQMLEASPPFNKPRKGGGISNAAPHEKERFREWCNDPKTEGIFYSAFEGYYPWQRITKQNPPAKLRAFVMDYDAPHERSEWALGLRRFRRLPTFISKTFSGHLRAVWLLDRPVNVVADEHASELLRAIDEGTGASKGFAGVDPASFRSTQLFESGTEWEKTGELLPFGLVNGWAMEAAGRVDFSSSSFGAAVPLDSVREEMQRRFPGTWTGPFERGCRGPRFWVPGADNPTAAIVAETGMCCFTGNESFVPWAKIFDFEFVERHTTQALGEATEGIWYDGKMFWAASDDDPSSPLRDWGRDDVVLELRKRGLSTKKTDTQISEVERALHYITRINRVDFAAPFPYRPPGQKTIKHNGCLAVNTSRCQALAPEPAGNAPKTWGEGFPWLAEFFGKFFAHPAEEQLRYFIAWAARFYANAQRHTPKNGQTLFLAGPADKGKSLISSGILHRLMGGRADAASYLSGGTTFNADLAEKGLWVVDDNSDGNDDRGRDKRGAIMKRIISGVGFSWQPKFRNKVDLPFEGRIVVTLNEEPESLRVIPKTERSLMDKVSFLRGADHDFVFPEREETERILGEELPHFARFLIEHKPAAELLGTSRYGLKAYHHETLVAEVQSAERGAVLAGFLDNLAEAVHGKRKESGPVSVNASGLISLADEWRMKPELDGICRGNAITLGRMLTELAGLPGGRVKLKEKEETKSKKTNIYILDLRHEHGAEEPF